MSDIVRFFEVDNSIAPALEKRGVRWPMAGFSPGRCTLVCEKCGCRHQAADRSVSCLPCAVATAVDVGLRAAAAQTRAFYRGRKAGLDDVARFVAAGAQTWREGLPPAVLTPEQRADVKRQRDEAERRVGDPEGVAEVDDLVARTKAARERIDTGRRDTEASGNAPDGGAA